MRKEVKQKMSERYKIYVDDVEKPNRVFVISSYAGKPVRGKAKCSPTDKFDLEVGKKLALMRCDLKVAELRLKRANEKFAEANQKLTEAEMYYDRMADYFTDSEEAFFNLKDEYESYLETL